MRINLGHWDRTIRLLTGSLLTIWLVAGGPWWTMLGFFLIATAAWRFCPFYAVFQIGTAQRPS